MSGRPKAGVTFWDRVRANTIQTERGCLEFRGCRDGSGYGRITKDGKLVRIHRASWSAKFGTIPDGLCVCHTCDNPACWNVEHLFLGSHADNMADMKTKGRAVGHSREQNPAAKLDEAKVASIRSEKGTAGRLLAKRYGVSKSLIGAIRRGQVWA